MFRLLLLMLASATTAQARDPDPPDELSIVNGAKEKGYPSTIATGISQGGLRFSSCTASLITPRMLLTAAHCSEETGYPPELIIQFGAAFLGPDVNEAPDVRFADIKAHPGYRGIGGSQGTPVNDFAVIELEEDVTDIEPVWINTERLHSEDVGTSLISVGYGVTDGASQSGGGIKRSAPIVISDLDGQFIVSNSEDNPGEGNVCSGDSGGPQYHVDEDGRMLQWSVHSWADQYCLFTSGSSRTDVGAEWILNQVERVHGSTDFCAISGKYLDGACDDWCDTIDPDCVTHPGGNLVGGGAELASVACNHGRATPATSGALGLLLSLALIRRRHH